MTGLTYRWEYPIRTDVLDQVPGRVLTAVRAAAIRDAAEDGWRPNSIPTVTRHPGPSPVWSTVRVEFSALPVDTTPAATGPCVLCGTRPAWGPGARRCRTCVSAADWEAVTSNDRTGTCGDRYGTRAGAQAHYDAGEPSCSGCRRAAAVASKAARRKQAV